MSESNEHTKVYTAAEIQKYLSGRMTAQEMNALERAALEDPFLSDAIEGMQEGSGNYGIDTVQQQLDLTKEALQKRITEKKPGRVIPLFWQRASVAAILVIIAGTWLYTSNRNVEEQKEVLAIDQKKEASPVPDQTISDSTNNGQVQPEAAKAIVSDEADTREKSTKEVPNATKDQATVTSELNPKQELQEPKNEKSDKLASKEISAAPKSPVNAAESKSIQTERERIEIAKQEDRLENSANIGDKKAAPARSHNITSKPIEYINLKVVDSNNLPIANASVTDLEKRKTYLTDQNGNLKLPYSDTVINASIASVGYQSKQIQLKSDVETNKIQLSPAGNLSEVVVVGLGANDSKKKEKLNYSRRSPKVMVQDAEPVIGWVDYNKYLDSAKSTVAATISGDVVISFLVNKAGEASSYKIEQSVSEQQDRAALDIVKTGSAWRLLKGKKQRVYVIVRF